MPVVELHLERPGLGRVANVADTSRVTGTQRLEGKGLAFAAHGLLAWDSAARSTGRMIV